MNPLVLTMSKPLASFDSRLNALAKFTACVTGKKVCATKKRRLLQLNEVTSYVNLLFYYCNGRLKLPEVILIAVPVAFFKVPENIPVTLVAVMLLIVTLKFGIWIVPSVVAV